MNTNLMDALSEAAVNLDLLPGQVVGVKGAMQLTIRAARADLPENAHVYGLVARGSSFRQGGDHRLDESVIATHGVLELSEAEWRRVIDDEPGVLGELGGLVPGSVYFLSEKTAGNLTRSPVRWAAIVGTAVTHRAMSLNIRAPERRFGPHDVVESVWIRSDDHALAFAFADGTDAVFASDTRILSVATADFIGPLSGQGSGARHVGNRAFDLAVLDAANDEERAGAVNAGVMVQRALCGPAGILHVRMLGAQLDQRGAEIYVRSSGLVFLANETMSEQAKRTDGPAYRLPEQAQPTDMPTPMSWRPVPVTGRVRTFEPVFAARKFWENP